VLTIRETTPDDRNAMIHIADRVFNVNGEIYGPISRATDERYRKDYIAAYTAEDDGKIVGYVVTTHCGRGIKPPTSSIDLIAVDDAYHGKGIGTALMARAMQRCRENGSEYVSSATWETNHGSRKIHAKMGFREEKGYGEYRYNDGSGTVGCVRMYANLEG
jgi:GNAT superfamily N-acetyltransferase